jgi:type I restriction-modification system DNA methylase subunit
VPKLKKNSTPANDADATIGYETRLWQMADALRGSMDAAEYKHVVLGLTLLEVHDALSVVTTTERVHAAFEQFAYNVWRRTKLADEQTRTLAGLRDALLPKLMSDEVRVKDAERFLAGTPSVPSEVVT